MTYCGWAKTSTTGRAGRNLHRRARGARDGRRDYSASARDGLLPKVPAMMAFAADMPAAPPPPPPPPPPPAPKPAVPQEEPKVVPNPLAAPVVAPSAITPELPQVEARRRQRRPGRRRRRRGRWNRDRPRAATAATTTATTTSAEAAGARVGGNITAPALVKRVEPTIPTSPWWPRSRAW